MRLFSLNLWTSSAVKDTELIEGFADSKDEHMELYSYERETFISTVYQLRLIVRENIALLFYLFDKVIK